MNSSNPRIPLWVFFTTDFALLGAAAFIAAYSARPLSTGAVFGIIACVLTGAIVALVPLIVRFERQKNEALDERQRSLEALASTVSATAEQISIATAGLQQITEIAQKNLRHAEQLPHRLHEKIAEFQSQVASVSDAEKDELERELAALRGSETERLESISDRIAKATADLAKLEAASHQHLSAANEAVGKLALGTANAIGKAQAAAEQALAHARVEAARHVGESAGQHVRALEAAKAAALADLEARLASAGAAIADRIAHDVSGKIAGAIAGLDAALSRARPAEATLQREHSPAPAPATSEAPPAREGSQTAAPPMESKASVPSATAPPERSESPAPTAAPTPAAPAGATPKRPRKTKREEPAAEISAAAPASTRVIAAVDEPAPLPLQAIPEVAPVAPHTAEPFSAAPAHAVSTNGNGRKSPRAPAPGAEPAANEEHVPTRRRAAAAAAPVAVDDAAVPAGVVERVLTSDGATRLIVTAYIGIGNRLFIRGDGPGLSWNKGVPLQFVSIGKWRWETNDATDPIRFKLLKNDEQECTSLGAQTLDPGHQQEVSAAF